MYESKNAMIAALTALTCIDTVSHEYPDYYEIILSNGITIDLGEMDDESGYGWNSHDGIELGLTREKAPEHVALAFSKWVKNTYYHKCQTCMKRSAQ